MVRDTRHSLQTHMEKDKLRRHVRAVATGADADARRQRDRERNRERQRRYRERLRVRRLERTPSEHPIENDHPMDETASGLQECLADVDVHDDVTVDVETPPYLPPHQERAVHEFLDRLLLIRDDLHECTTCLEKYHGMQMHGTECARCHKEVCI